jgi:hypothetical protein
MKTLLILFSLLALTAILSGCSGHGMGHRYTNTMHSGQAAPSYVERNGMRSNGPYEW